MKLNYKRVILVGFAFFIISAFWQSYDNVMPLILTNKFGLNQTVSGVIMALDNILAVFLPEADFLPRRDFVLPTVPVWSMQTIVVRSRWHYITTARRSAS